MSNNLKNPIQSEFTEIETILSEVKQHGFYSNYCVNLIQGIENNDALINEIRQMASKALLSVTFNFDKTICVFED